VVTAAFRAAARAAVGTGAFVLLFAILLAGGAPARADDEPAYLKLSAGYKGDIFADRKSGGFFAFEYRAGPSLELWHIRPSFGIGATTDTSVYGWTALNLDIYFGSRLVLTPSTGIGLYSKGKGQDLGGALEFRNGAELAWRFDDMSRLGIGLHYLSNYGIGDSDPGLGIVTLFYAHPLTSILPD
jgi:lipid A 3-O-deacylase